MSFATFTIPAVLGRERLDHLDRQILETVCKHGREGQSFNKLVEEVKSFASRSTFAFRTKRLQKLGYIETLDDPQKKQVKKIRGKPLALLIARLVARIKAQCGELERSLESGKSVTSSQIDDGFLKKKQILEDTSQKMKGIFSLIPTYALYLGEAAAGDLLLPMLIDDFRKLNSGLASFIASDRRILSDIELEKLAMIPMDSLKEDFKFAFGVEMNEALPNFSEHLRKLAQTSQNKK